MRKKGNQLYSNMPNAPEKKIFGSNPYPQPVVGSEVNRIVPAKQPRLTGFAGTHGYGHTPKQKKGHLRVSGHSGAHLIGGKKKY